MINCYHLFTEVNEKQGYCFYDKDSTCTVDEDSVLNYSIVGYPSLMSQVDCCLFREGTHWGAAGESSCTACGAVEEVAKNPSSKLILTCFLMKGLLHVNRTNLYY